MNLESWLEACSFCKYLLLGVKNVVDIKIHMVSSDNILSALDSINKGIKEFVWYPIASASFLARFLVSLDDCLAMPI